MRKFVPDPPIHLPSVSERRRGATRTYNLMAHIHQNDAIIVEKLETDPSNLDVRHPWFLFLTMLAGLRTCI